MEDKYIKDLVSMIKEEAISNGNPRILNILRDAQEIKLELNYSENWNGGTDYYDLIIYIDSNVYRNILSEIPSFQEKIMSSINRYHRSDFEIISSVQIQPSIVRVLDWESVYPRKDEDVLESLTDEKNMLINIGTGKKRIQEEEDRFKQNHKLLAEWSNSIGFDYPVKFKSLWDWYNFYSDNLSTYAQRRSYISELYDPIFKQIENDLKRKEEQSVLSFNISKSESPTIQKAILSANNCLLLGNYEEAIDRIHTSFHGYLRELLTSHDIEYQESDSLQQLYKKLHNYYEINITPKEIATLVKTCLRSATGIIASINDTRNKYSMAHPNEILIGKREAKLVIQLVQDIVNYIDEVEDSIES